MEQAGLSMDKPACLARNEPYDRYLPLFRFFENLTNRHSLIGRDPVGLSRFGANSVMTIR
ncbi:hypothetical protein [Saccharibacillus brassicae]|uniref:Uncharacterized protein n=1 Tax=Saccharibacillus brassicae TaxID=2583377 RepID=A0A4Y6UT65_SACBS|nr:hypothetical protein [Saccharibacillus brassicae]QDH20254.1 hypothetical protein FFV09_04900 [Saccharibacillus brassicae]